MKIVYLLDTNIVSELFRPAPDERVVSAFRTYDGMMAIPAVVWHELLYGLARLPDGQRKRRIRAGIYDVVAPSLPVENCFADLPHGAWKRGGGLQDLFLR